MSSNTLHWWKRPITVVAAIGAVILLVTSYGRAFDWIVQKYEIWGPPMSNFLRKSYSNSPILTTVLFSTAVGLLATVIAIWQFPRWAKKPAVSPEPPADQAPQAARPEVGLSEKQMDELAEKIAAKLRKQVDQAVQDEGPSWHDKYPNGYSIFALTKNSYVTVPGSNDAPHTLHINWHEVSAKAEGDYINISLPPITGDGFVSMANTHAIQKSLIQVGYVHHLTNVGQIELVVEVAHITTDGTILVFGARPYEFYWRVRDSALEDFGSGIDVFVSLGIRNQTRSLVLSNWRLSMSWMGGRKVKAAGIASPQELPADWDVANYLPSRLAGQACPVGVPVDGWIQFHFPDVKRSELDRLNMLTFEFDRPGKTEHYDFPLSHKPRSKLQ